MYPGLPCSVNGNTVKLNRSHKALDCVLTISDQLHDRYDHFYHLGRILSNPAPDVKLRMTTRAARAADVHGFFVSEN